jgi:hypothetical protein
MIPGSPEFWPCRAPQRWSGNSRLAGPTKQICDGFQKFQVARGNCSEPIFNESTPLTCRAGGTPSLSAFAVQGKIKRRRLP